MKKKMIEEFFNKYILTPFELCQSIEVTSRYISSDSVTILFN